MIKDYIQKCRSQNPKEFTTTIKQFCKDYSNQYFPSLGFEECEILLSECEKIFYNSKDANSRYNALRLLKFSATHDDFLSENYEYFWKIYLDTIHEENGNIRNAGVHMLGRFIMGIQCLVRPYPFKNKKSTKYTLSN